LRYNEDFGGAYLIWGKPYKKLGDKTKALAEFERAKNDRTFQKNALYENDLIKSDQR